MLERLDINSLDSRVSKGLVIERLDLHRLHSRRHCPQILRRRQGRSAEMRSGLW